MNIAQEALGLENEEVTAVEEPVFESETSSIGLSNIFSGVLDLLRVETGAGEIKDYVDLPLNFDKSEGLAQILRGASGFIGANFLRSAILDIVVGFWRWTGRGGNTGA